MAEIHLLESSVYNRIAAGEVVERPFSVVKELVENAIDAGAGNISVYIYEGGISRIRILDDGCGIERGQLSRAFLPHATSKIRAVEDLDCIHTLGFRGEALASIASVAHVKICTRTQESEVGASIRADGGEISDVEDAAAAFGTEIVVDRLFYNTPVRAKFLKTSRGEESDIANLMTRLILGNPGVAFRYFADDKLIYQSFGTGLEEAMIAVYGASVISNCFEIDAERSGIKLRGYIGKHHFTKPNRTYQSLFVNGRYIVNGAVSGAISNAYGSYLMKRQYPFYVLSMDMPADEVDVNVHPNKTDVRFQNNQKVFGAVYSVVSAVLDGTSTAIDIVKNEAAKEARPVSAPQEQKRGAGKSGEIGAAAAVAERGAVRSGRGTPVARPDAWKPTYPMELEFRDSGVPRAEKSSFLPPEKPEQRFAPRPEKTGIIAPAQKSDPVPLPRERIPAAPTRAYPTEQGGMDVAASFRYIGQAMNTYLLFERGQDLYLVDQHAAHERLNYDRFMADMESGNIATQQMLVPYILRVNGQESEFLAEKSDLLREMGFEIEEFGRDTYRVSAVPVVLGAIRLEDFFSDLLSGVGGLKREKVPDILKDKIAQTACKASVKSGNKLSEGEANALIDRMKGNMGLKCPHGRPVAVKISRAEIDKWFKRIV